jgi:hypothetical protein
MFMVDFESGRSSKCPLALNRTHWGQQSNSLGLALPLYKKDHVRRSVRAPL